MTMHPTLATALERIAAREGCAVTALPPLYDTIDPEALATNPKAMREGVDASEEFTAIAR